MKYQYIGDGPFPQHLIGRGIVVSAKEDIVDVEYPINHPHFKEIVEKKVKPKTEGTE